MERVSRSIRERRVFVDSSAFLAVVASDDDFHQQALITIRRCARERHSLLTTRYVIVETYAGLIGAVGTREARAFLRNGLEEIAVEPVSDADFKRAEMIVFQFEDKDYSYCDAISFAVMERLHLSLAYAFDTHFRQHGFSTPFDRQDWP